jgi:ClpP class serine protease
VDGNELQPLSEEREAELKQMADTALKHFAKDVARGRGVTTAAVLKGFGNGLALPAVEAKAAGLIDRIATMDEVISKLVGRKAGAGMRAEFEMEPLIAGAPVPEIPEEIAATIERVEAEITADLSLPPADDPEGERLRRLRLL